MGLIGKSGLVQGSVQPIAATVAGEHSAGSIRTVSCGGQADDEQVGHRIAEVRNGQAPVFPFLKGSPLGSSDFLAIASQPGTAFACYDSLL